MTWHLKTVDAAYPRYWYCALDYVNYGSKLAESAYGCVAIKTRSSGGHVCSLLGVIIVCIGGNQSNKVYYEFYNEPYFQGCR